MHVRARESCNARAFFPAELIIQSHVHERIPIVNDVIFSIPGSHEHPMSRCTGMQANAILCAGGRAQICGLVVAPEWNGKYGTLLRRRADNKWLVHIDGREIPGWLWPANLVPHSDPPAVAPCTAPALSLSTTTGNLISRAAVAAPADGLPPTSPPPAPALSPARAPSRASPSGSRSRSPHHSSQDTVRIQQ